MSVLTWTPLSRIGHRHIRHMRQLRGMSCWQLGSLKESDYRHLERENESVTGVNPLLTPDVISGWRALIGNGPASCKICQVAQYKLDPGVVTVGCNAVVQHIAVRGHTPLDFFFFFNSRTQSYILKAQKDEI